MEGLCLRVSVDLERALNIVKHLDGGLEVLSKLHNLFLCGVQVAACPAAPRNIKNPVKRLSAMVP